MGGALTGMLAHLVGRRGRRPEAVEGTGQLSLDFTPPTPAAGRHEAEALLARLRALGLATGAAAGGIDGCRLTRNRTVMVSFRGGELRVHRGYVAAPELVLRAIVAFVHARTRAQRAAAQRVILSFPAQEAVGERAAAERPRRRQRTEAGDEPMVRVLIEWHRRYNALHFAGGLTMVSIRVSRRLRRRLGHYTAALPSTAPAEIVLSRSHIRRHGWDEALHTLLHEMVHQWQDECGLAIDHGPIFRRKARDVGITAAARRAVRRRDESAA